MTYVPSHVYSIDYPKGTPILSPLHKLCIMYIPSSSPWMMVPIMSPSDCMIFSLQSPHKPWVESHVFHLSCIGFQPHLLKQPQYLPKIIMYLPYVHPIHPPVTHGRWCHNTHRWWVCTQDYFYAVQYIYTLELLPKFYRINPKTRIIFPTSLRDIFWIPSAEENDISFEKLCQI